MAKRSNRFLALVLVACMCVSALPLQALAAEVTTETSTEISPEGLTTDVITTTTTDTDENGNTTVIVTIEKSTKGTTEDGVDVDRVESSTATTVTDANGNVIGESWAEDGSETKQWTEEDTGDGDQPDVTVELIPGETTTGSAVTTDEAQDGETKTTVTERTVEATLSESEIVVESTGSGEFAPIQTDHDMIYVEENQLHTHSKTSYCQTSDPTTAMQNKPEDEQYDFLFIGQGQMSDFYVGVEDISGDEGHSGALQFELLYDPTVENGQYVKVPEDLFTTYCIDLTTGAVAGYWYKMDDLEDAGYYSEEAAAHIRSIVTTGYWGTNPGEDEEAPATGSLEKLKQAMREAGNTGLTDEEIDQLTPGQALAATQAAIWSYANETSDGFVDEERLILTGYKAPTVPTDDDFKKAMAVYSFLRELEPTGAEESTEIIDKDSFIQEDSMSITVGDKVEGNDANSDDDQDNDVYDVTLNFALVVTPGGDDDLIVQVVRIGEDGELVVAAQGRIAGDASADEGFSEVAFDEETGVYSLKGLQLAENSDFNFDLQLVGTQYLQEGVYIFNSEVRNGVSSQTFVGLVEGQKEVNVKQSFVIKFDVDENTQVVTERVWQDESDPIEIPDEEPPVEEEDPPREYRMGSDDSVLEIPDEEVPLADAPTTGDNSGLWIVMIMMAAAVLYVVNVISKKRQHEAF